MMVDRMALGGVDVKVTGKLSAAERAFQQGLVEQASGDKRIRTYA